MANANCASFNFVNEVAGVGNDVRLGLYSPAATRNDATFGTGVSPPSSSLVVAFHVFVLVETVAGGWFRRTGWWVRFIVAINASL